MFAWFQHVSANYTFTVSISGGLLLGVARTATQWQDVGMLSRIWSWGDDSAYTSTPGGL